MKGPARNGVNPPNERRHRLEKIGKHSKPDDQNTVILPDVDVESDLEAIRNDQARWRPEIGRYEVNGRLWGIEPNGTAFPDSGPGLAKLSRSEYKALIGLIQAGGDMDRRPMKWVRNKSISDADWQRAADVYRYHPGNRQGER